MIKTAEADFRKLILRGKKDEGLRFAWKLVEALLFIGRQFNVSQIVGIIDMSGASFRQHACTECLAFAQEIAERLQENYPQLCAHMFLINSKYNWTYDRS